MGYIHLGKGEVFQTLVIWGRGKLLEDFFFGRAFDNGISSKYPIGCAATGFCAAHEFQTRQFFGEGKEYDAYSLVDSTVDSKKNCFSRGGCGEQS